MIIFFPNLEKFENFWENSKFEKYPQFLHKTMKTFPEVSNCSQFLNKKLKFGFFFQIRKFQKKTSSVFFSKFGNNIKKKVCTPPTPPHTHTKLQIRLAIMTRIFTLKAVKNDPIHRLDNLKINNVVLLYPK